MDMIWNGCPCLDQMALITYLMDHLMIHMISPNVFNPETGLWENDGDDSDPCEFDTDVPGCMDSTATNYDVWQQ